MKIDKCKIIEPIDWKLEEISASEEPQCYDIEED